MNSLIPRQGQGLEITQAVFPFVLKNKSLCVCYVFARVCGVCVCTCAWVLVCVCACVVLEKPLLHFRNS